MSLKFLPALLLLVASAAVAQTPPSKNPADIPAGTYSIDRNHAKALFAISHFGLSTYYGGFTEVQGTLTLVPQKPETSKLEVKIPVDSLATNNPTLDKELRGPQWFDSANFPAMAFTSTAIKLVGKDGAQVTGNLTLHGVTKPITLNVKFNGGAANPLNKRFTVGFEVSGSIKRSDFGIKNYVPMIGDDVQLIISAPFENLG